MAESKKKSRLWLWVTVLVIVLAGAGYFIYRNVASANVPSQTANYSFEILSKNKLTLQKIPNTSAPSWRINEPVQLGSGFAVRVRQDFTNQIVNKNLTWATTNNEGFFSLQSNDALVAYYPRSTGAHNVSVTFNTATGAKRTLNLQFSTPWVTTPPLTPTPVGSPTVTPRPSVVADNRPVITVYYNGATTEFSTVDSSKNVITVKKGTNFTITANWPQPVNPTSLQYSTTCVQTSTACQGSSFLNLKQFSGGERNVGLSATGIKVGSVDVSFKVQNSSANSSNSIRVNISE